MQIRVGTSVTAPRAAPYPALTCPVRPRVLRRPERTRYITLNEIEPEDGGLVAEPELPRISAPGARASPGRDRGGLGTSSTVTPDTHPMHTHLFNHQVIGRVPFDAEATA